MAASKAYSIKNHLVFSSALLLNRHQSRDGILFSSFLSVLIHLVVIFGVTFFAPTSSRGFTVDLVLVHAPVEESPRDKQYKSYANQESSGEKKVNRPAKIPLIPIVVHHEILPQSRLVAGHSGSVRDPGKVLGDGTDELRSSSGPPIYATGARGADAHSETINTARDSLDAEIIGLESYLGALEEQYAKYPRIKRFTSIGAQNSVAAAYIHNWVRRVERIGNLNYPQQAARQKVSGELRLLVVLNAIGRVVDVRVLESSGYKILDDAAPRIVRIAEPFGEFPLELRDQADRIEIIRTWRFVAEGEATRLQFE